MSSQRTVHTEPVVDSAAASAHGAGSTAAGTLLYHGPFEVDSAVVHTADAARLLPPHLWVAQGMVVQGHWIGMLEGPAQDMVVAGLLDNPD